MNFLSPFFMMTEKDREKNITLPHQKGCRRQLACKVPVNMHKTFLCIPVAVNNNLYHLVHLRIPQASSSKYKVRSEAGLFGSLTNMTAQNGNRPWARLLWYWTAQWGGKQNYLQQLYIFIWTHLVFEYRLACMSLGVCSMWMLLCLYLYDLGTWSGNYSVVTRSCLTT